MVTDQQIDVEVAYARRQSQALLSVKGAAGLTVAEAIERSGILDRFPEIDLGVNKVGIFGKATTLSQPLQAGDRVEIYPPLIADPKQARKTRADEGKAAARRPQQGAAPRGSGPKEASE
ncbi:MAG: RnfH family protein [Thiohalocapsa sp.]|jgi:putative ubiquitin-RnfH superfamily antitoxin RatB of RatAB toxin-antitoxin module|nr:RnfH family protein [Thiohalocapsa sp.]MCF7989723.1 RnfH family protein [Thiohalocapsa sp.]